jgi:hypothetical protein
MNVFGRIGLVELFMFPVGFFMTIIIPALVLYFVVKLAVKNAIIELKRNGTL